MGPFTRAKMAALLCRVGANVARRTTSVYGARFMSDDHIPSTVDPHKGKVAVKGISMPDGFGHSVGAERYELLAKMAGVEDPFEKNVRPRTAGTRDDPNIEPSMFDKRIVGCVCEEDSISVNWMYLHRGECKRCECGYYFKLVDLKPLDL